MKNTKCDFQFFDICYILLQITIYNDFVTLRLRLFKSFTEDILRVSTTLIDSSNATIVLYKFVRVYIFDKASYIFYNFIARKRDEFCILNAVKDNFTASYIIGSQEAG